MPMKNRDPFGRKPQRREVITRQCFECSFDLALLDFERRQFETDVIEHSGIPQYRSVALATDGFDDFRNSPLN